MKVQFDIVVNEGDVVRSALTVDHIIIYPGSSIVINGKNGVNKNLHMEGLSDAVSVSMLAFLSVLSADIKGEFQTNLVSSRADAKIASETVEKSQLSASEVKLGGI